MHLKKIASLLFTLFYYTSCTEKNIIVKIIHTLQHNYSRTTAIFFFSIQCRRHYFFFFCILLFEIFIVAFEFDTIVKITNYAGYFGFLNLKELLLAPPYFTQKYHKKLHKNSLQNNSLTIKYLI